MEDRPHSTKYLKDVPYFHNSTIPSRTLIVFSVNEYQPAGHRNETNKEVCYSKACYKAVGARAQIGILEEGDDDKSI